MGWLRKKALPFTVAVDKDHRNAFALNTPGPRLVLLISTAVLPLTSPLMMKVSAFEPGPPRNASTARVELPEATKARSLPPSVLEISNDPHRPVLQGNEARILEALQIDE